MSIDVVESGSGPSVVLLHGSVSGNRQWKKLSAMLADRYRVVAPNLTGYGGTPAWSNERAMTLDDAAEVVHAVCALLDAPIRIVGHSMGAGLALWAAKDLGPKVSHLALYEPMKWGLLLGHGRTEAAAEAAAMHADVKRMSREGRWHDLGRRFTDYFGGEGAWGATPAARQDTIAASLPPNVHEWDRSAQPLHADVFAGISAKVLLMVGTETPLVLRETAALLVERFPDWRLEWIAGCGHMGPMSHPDTINPKIAAFLHTPA